MINYNTRHYGRYGYNSHPYHRGYTNYAHNYHGYQPYHHLAHPVPHPVEEHPEGHLVIKELPLLTPHPHPEAHEVPVLAPQPHLETHEVVHQQVVPAGEVVVGEETHIVNPIPGQFLENFVVPEDQQFVVVPEGQQFFQAPVQQVVVPEEIGAFADAPEQPLLVRAPPAFADPRSFAELNEGQFVIPPALPAFPAVPVVA